MSDPDLMVDPVRDRANWPASPRCAACGIVLAEPYGWCAGCRAAYCLPCGRRHFCTPSCPANGCLPGLCVHLVEGGVLAETWGLPDEGEEGGREGVAALRG